MAYTQGDPILKDHYNEFISGNPTVGVANHIVPNINTLWGVGIGDKGYGQPALAEVAIGNVITATQWSSMLARMSSMGQHQNTSLTANTSPTIGDVIEALNDIATNMSALSTNRLVALTTGSSDTVNASGNAAWNNESVHTVDVEFASGDAARYFFNAGGHIDLTFSRNGGSATGKNDDWTDILSDCGTVRLSAQNVMRDGGVVPVPGDEVINDWNGYYSLTGVGTRIFRRFMPGGGPYSSNSIDILAHTNTPQGVNADNGSIITFEITIADVASDPPSVDGTMSVTALARYPSDTHLLSPSWGTVNFTTNVVQS